MAKITRLHTYSTIVLLVYYLYLLTKFLAEIYDFSSCCTRSALLDVVFGTFQNDRHPLQIDSFSTIVARGTWHFCDTVRPYKETSDVFPPKFRPITLRRIDDVIQNCSDDVISVRTSLPICHEVLSSCQQVCCSIER